MFEYDSKIVKIFKELLADNERNRPTEAQAKATLKKIEKLANTGWLLPTNETVEDHWNFLNNTDNSEELNRLFVEYFNRDNNIQRIIDKFNEDRNQTNLKEIYNQAVYLYNNQMYAGAVIILCALYESLIREQINYVDEKSVSSNVNSYLSKRYTDKMTLIFQDRKGIGNFTEKFFSKIDYDKIDDTNYFNRNVILHGIEYKRISEIDVLKLLNAIDVLNGLICDYEKLWEEENE